MGRKLPALHVFAMAIRYLVDDMHKVVDNRILGGISKQEVYWVLTVAAIWTDSAKTFMREAGIKAGIPSHRLSIALEPEAASIFCRHLPVSQRRDETGVNVASFQNGVRYIVLDAGGGTVDITVHEVQRSGAVKEVIPASGGGWGGTEVDRAFENLIIELVGSDVYVDFKYTQTEDWLDLWRDFEVKKRSVRPDKESKIMMKLPVSLNELYGKKNRGRSLTESIAASRYRENMEVYAGKIKFKDTVFKSLFETPLVQTTQHIQERLRDTKVGDITAILMVGGFSDSPMLQNKIKSSFPEIDIIIPLEAVSSILRGAMIFGHSPKSITERVVKYTYGLEAVALFIKVEHPESKRVVYDCGVRCKDAFDKHVEQGQVVKVGEPQVRKKYKPTNKGQQKIVLPIFASELKNPKYTDQGCTKIGVIEIDISNTDGDMDREAFVSFTFSGTEIEVEAEIEKNGDKN